MAKDPFIYKEYLHWFSPIFSSLPQAAFKSFQSCIRLKPYLIPHPLPDFALASRA